MKDKVKKGGGRNQVKTDVISAPGGDDVVDIKQDEGTAFPVKIQGAGVEPFELQVNAFWLVQDAIMALLSRNEVCPRSNLSLALAGTTLDPHAVLQSLKGLKAGALIRLVEEPYTSHSARHHLARVVELLRASGPHDVLREGQSPSVLETLTHTPDSSLPNGKSLKRSLSNSKGESANQDGAPPEYLLPGSSERPLMALLPHSSQPEAPSYLKDLSLSCWHPPPGHRKLQGDFMYITAVTIEGRHCDITSCPKGFFLNRSTEDMFDPRPAQSTPVCHCLTDLLCHISPTFKQAFTTLKNRPQQPPVEAMPTPYHTLCWLGPPCVSRLHKNTFSRLGVDEQAAAQTPDWNEELQAARDLPQGSLEERLQRDKALLQVNSAFVRTVMQGAETVVDGFVEPVNGNPEDPAFLWNGLFMSQGATSAVFGGERGRRAAQRLELKGVQAYSNLEGLQGLHTLPTAIVDYRGVRLSAQGLAPGFESSEQDQKDSPASRGLLYGVNAGPQESTQRRRLLALLAHAAKSLSIQRHVVVAPKGHQVPLFTSLDAQGLLGADGRFYLLDVFRSFPVDANFYPEGETQSQTAAGDEERSNNSKENNEEKKNGNEKEGWPENYQGTSGFPKRFPHGLCRLRPELVQAFIQHKHCQFTQRVKEKMDENGGFEECATACDSRATDAVRAACRDVGSISDIIFEMRFNPNVFSPGICFPPTEKASTNLQEKLLREAAAFIITHQIPAFLQCCLESNEAPMDGASLKQALHQKGVNLRYLGHVVKAISQSEHKERLRHIMRSTIGEIFIRSAKRVFSHFLQGVDVPSLSAAISHFLSCLLVHHFTPSPVGEEAKKKSRRRGRGAGASESTPWSMLTGSELWNLVCQDAVETYDISDSLGSSPNHLVEHYGLQKLSLLREFCLKTGVQMRLRDYILENQNKAPISPDDILNIFPVVKHISMPTVDASKAYRAAQNSIQKGLLDQAHEQLKEAAYLYGRVCDDLDPEACYCNSLLAKVTFLQGKAAEARSVQLKTVVISERVLGFDHPNTIQQYALLAVYAYAGGETTLAQKCLLRARLLMLTVHGEDHPYTATLDSCLGLILTEEQTGQFLLNALKLNTSFFGPTDLHTALRQDVNYSSHLKFGCILSKFTLICLPFPNHNSPSIFLCSHHLLAQWMCSKGDYRSAMTHEKEALSAFTSLFGEDHPQTSCSKEFLGTITKQAVKVERTLRQTGSESAEQTVECLSPTSETILEQMVLVTGIRRITRSDRFQEYKQKHLERKAAAAKELGFKLPIWPVNSHLVSREEKSLNKDSGSGKEAGDEGTTAEKKDGESQQQQPQENMSTDSGAGVLANGHVIEPVERNKHEKKTDVDADGEAADADAGVQTVNEGEMQSASGGKNGEINGDMETIHNPSALNSKLSWADVVSKSSNGTGGKTVNGVDSVTANGAAEE